MASTSRSWDLVQRRAVARSRCTPVASAGAGRPYRGAVGKSGVQSRLSDLKGAGQDHGLPDLDRAHQLLDVGRRAPGAAEQTTAKKAGRRSVRAADRLVSNRKAAAQIRRTTQGATMLRCRCERSAVAETIHTL